MGKVFVIFLVGSAAIAGALMYYLQVYAFYDALPEQTALQITRTDGSTAQLELARFEGIDATSSPLRMRACAQIDDLAILEGAQPATKPDPLVAPRWFACFDARAIGEAIKAGEAQAYLSHHEVARGVDRVIAVFPDGRAFVWHQLNGTLEN